MILFILKLTGSLGALVNMCLLPITTESVSRMKELERGKN